MSAASEQGTPTPAVLDTLSHVRGRVREQLGELLDALDHEGGRYADRYAAALLSPATRTGPPAPRALAGPAAGIVRELVRDEVTAVRLYGVPR